MDSPKISPSLQIALADWQCKQKYTKQTSYKVGQEQKDQITQK